jgi:hypothetical protein
MHGRQLADAITFYAETAVIGDGHLQRGMHAFTKPFAMDTPANRVSGIPAG